MGDGCRLNRPAYVKLIHENLVWLEKQPKALERSHIEAVLTWSVNQLYGPADSGPDHEWTESVGPAMCVRCLARREFAGAYYAYTAANGGYSGLSKPPCEPAEKRSKE